MSEISEYYDNPDMTSDVLEMPPEQVEHEVHVISEMNELERLAQKYLWSVSWMYDGNYDLSLVISDKEPTEKMALEVISEETGFDISYLKEEKEKGEFEIMQIYKIYPTNYEDVKGVDNVPF